jgi:hypothetical protein
MQRVTEALEQALHYLSMASHAENEKLRDEYAKLARGWMNTAIEIQDEIRRMSQKAN